MNAATSSSACASPPRLRPVRCADRGSALIAVLIFAVVMATALASVVSYVNRSAQLAKRSSLHGETAFAADYAFEQAFQDLKTLVSKDSTTVPTIEQTTGVTNLSTAPTGIFTAADGYVWKSYLTVPLDGGVIAEAHSNYDATKGVYRYLTVAEFERSVPTMTLPINVQYQCEWSYVLTPLFQFAIFYNDDMELFPGAGFTVAGRVHSNGTIYTGSSASLTYKNYVSYVDDISNQYSPLDPRGPGSPGDSVIFEQGPAVATTPESPPGLNDADTGDFNSNNDGPRELIEIPDYVHPDPLADARVYNTAGLKVLANTTSSTLESASGVSVAPNSRVLLTADGTIIPDSDPLGAYLDTMFSSGSIEDYRESTTVTTTDVDVGLIEAGYSEGGLPATIPNVLKWPNNASVPAALRDQPIPVALRGKDLWNGIVYVTDITDSSTHPVGVRLLNGTHLPDGTKSSSPQAGLTVVSENSAYIVGNYNTGGSPPVNGGSDLEAANFVSGYSVQPAALMADSVTIVSSNWTAGSYDSVSSVSSRNAVNTTVNTALISGIVASNGVAYSGGVENYLRLQENWSGRRLTYYGSIVNLYESQQATAPWSYGSYYTAPARNWYFDIGFLDPNRLPPGTPIVRSLKRGQWVQVR